MRRFAIVIMVPLLAGCAASVRESPRGDVAAPAARAASLDSAVVVELTMRRSAELSDSRGSLRVFDQDVRVEYRAGGRAPGLDAGEVTFAGRAMRREPQKNGAVVYRAGRDGSEHAGENPWRTLVNSGAVVPFDSVQVKIAAFPAVTRPQPGQVFTRGDEIALVTLPPIAGIWQRVSLTGAGDTAYALDLGEGRWLFPRSATDKLSAGAAKLLIEVETTCAACPAGPRLRATWSSRAELEIPITLL